MIRGVKSGSNKLIYLLFFLSGLAGLIYEVVWGRSLVLIFGSTTNSLVATISAFLGGLALGSFLAGKIVDRLPSRQLLRGYSLLELGVGLTALATPGLFGLVKTLYWQFSDGASVTTSLLAVKFLLTSLVILVPTSLMGATLPFLVRYLQLTSKKLAEFSLSQLYAINTFGGMAGVLLAGFALLELVGLKGSLLTAAALNLLVAVLAGRLKSVDTKPSLTLAPKSLKLTPTALAGIVGFGLSGLVSIAYQILWTRVLTPTLGTMIYAFAAILAFYLFGLALGSLIYPAYRRLVPQAGYGFGWLQLLIGLGAVLPVLVMHKVVLPPAWELTLRLLPSTLLLGLTFPAVIGLVKQPGATGQAIGLAYASNTIGAILGGYLASFVLIPVWGSSPAIVLLALVNFALAYYFFATEKESRAKLPVLALTAVALISTTYLLTAKGGRLLPFVTDIPILEAKLQQVPHQFLEDDVASVFAKQKSQHNEPLLVIDGVATTHRVSLTKYMAHLPITLHPQPKKVLIIAFGMGNTYRSALKHGLEVDAVELVPSVPKMANLFHPDNLLTWPNGRVIINDGRNYAFLTRKKYDIVVIDPPPPFNTAGSTVLHSLEYYEDLAKNLNPEGIVNQWIYAYGSRQDDISMAIRTFLEAFPYVLAVQKTDSAGGVFMLGSFKPIRAERLDRLMESQTVLKDLREFADKENFVSGSQPLEIIGDRDSLLAILNDFPLITDTQPRTEYYWLRHRFTQAPNLTGSDLDAFIRQLKAGYKPGN